MFYVLDFTNHTFTTCNYPEQAAGLIEQLHRDGVSDDELEIVIGAEDNRLSVEEFITLWC